MTGERRYLLYRRALGICSPPCTDLLVHVKPGLDIMWLVAPRQRIRDGHIELCLRGEAGGAAARLVPLPAIRREPHACVRRLSQACSRRRLGRGGVPALDDAADLSVKHRLVVVIVRGGARAVTRIPAGAGMLPLQGCPAQHMKVCCSGGGCGRLASRMLLDAHVRFEGEVEGPMAPCLAARPVP